MGLHYNAFISYRHSPKDSRVAALLQRMLERFRVPKAIREKTGVKKIDRLFRDKEELPITSDLNDDISLALRNADYLIVICSPRTGESMWVQREIELFLSNHSRRQVLTVLVEGEPEDIIPEILCYDVQIDPVTGEERRIPIEPLSCDWRMGDRKAKREELPRLAAAILGCGYDELRQRQRQYRMRRITAILSCALAAVVGLTAYFVKTSLTIRKNYEQSLVNQSQYLASESLSVLEQGDRMTAIQLALAALPDGTTERPVVPEAQRALSEAVGAYVSHSGDPVAVASFATEGHPVQFEVDAAGERIYILDDQNLLTVWDVVTCRRYATIRADGDVGGFCLCSQGIILWHEGFISAFDHTGQPLWSTEFSANLLTVAPDGKTLLAVGRDDEFNCVVCHLDSETGAITAPHRVIPFAEECNPTFYAMDTYPVSPDGRYIGFSAGGSYTHGALGYITDRRIYIYDWELAEGWFVDESFYLINDFCFTPENDVIVHSMKEDDGNFGFGSSYSLYNAHTLTSSYYDIQRIDIHSGEVEWENKLDYYQVSYENSVALCQDGQSVLAAAANVVCRLDCATGELLGRGEATAAILDVRMEQDDAYAVTILTDGSMANYSYEDGCFTCRPYFVDDLGIAHLTRGVDGYNNIYVSQRYAKSVLRYSFGIKDESVISFEGTQSRSVTQSWTTEDYLITLNYDDQMCVYSLDGQKLLHSIMLAENGYESHQIECLGLSDDHNYISFSCQGYDMPDIVRCYNVSSGEIVEYQLPQDQSCYRKALPVVANNTIYCALELYGGGTVLCLRGFDEDEWTMLNLESVQAGVTQQLFLLDRCVILCDEQGVCRMVDPDKMELKGLDIVLWREDPYLDEFKLLWDEETSVYAAVGKESIVLCHLDGSQMGEIPLNERKVISIAVHENTFFVLLSDYLLYRYDTNGAFLSRSDIASYLNASIDPDVCWYFLEDGTLALLCDGVLSLISPDGWKICGYAARAIGFDTKNDRLLVYTETGDGYGVAAFNRYSTQELVALGKALLGESQLSDEEKSQYGIS